MGRIDTDETNGRKAQGYAWASQAGAVLSNPFASELTRDSENPSPIMLRKWPCDVSSEIFGRKGGVALGFQAGMCCEKHLQARLRVSFQQQIQHSHSESTTVFSIFLSVFIRAIRGLKMLYSLHE
jgi:hypothetical protein